MPWRRERLPTPVFWPGEFHEAYSPWGRKESDTTERLSLHFSPKEILPYNTIWMNLEGIMLTNFTKDRCGTVLPWRSGSQDLASQWECRWVLIIQIPRSHLWDSDWGQVWARRLKISSVQTDAVALLRLLESQCTINGYLSVLLQGCEHLENKSLVFSFSWY